MSSILLKNLNIVTDNKIIKGNILIENQKIKKIYENYETLENEKNITEIFDLDNMYAGPAFIDVHIHGADGADTMDSNEEAIKKIANFLLREGTANFLLTTLTSTKNSLINTLKIAAKLQNQDIDGANIFGVHMEGPYFSKEFKGAQDDKLMSSASINEIEEYLNVKEGLIKLFSISPHSEENLEAIKFLKEKGVVTSVGHSNATFEEVIKATEYGLSHATHTYNGMKGFTHREPGVVGAIFNSDKIMAEVIFDKVHVHPEAVRTLIKIKGVDKVICITDSMRATGLTDGRYKLGGLDVIVKNNQARLVSNNALAGSLLTLDQAFRNLISIGYSLVDSFKMTATNAAKEFKLNTGEIKENKDADIVILDKDYFVKMTIVKGKVKYLNL